MLDHQKIAQSLNILAIFFRYAPDTENFQAVARYFESDWTSSWAVNIPEKYDLSALSDLARLPLDAWKRHFGIEYNLAVPPWGSVYTDPEEVLYGESTMRLQSELGALGIEFALSEKEPVDHIGLIFMVMANIALSGQLDYLSDFQEKHLTPWVNEYVCKLRDNVDSSAILAIIDLVEVTLRGVRLS